MLVHPRPGVDRRNLRQALADVHTDLVNLRGGQSGSPLYNYLNWVNSAVRRLGNQISRGDLDRLVLTRRYELLLGVRSQDVMGDTAGAYRGLLHNEIDERAQDLEEARAALDKQIGRWSNQALFLVPDTNFFIHHEQKIREVDFHKLVIGSKLYPHLRAGGGNIHILVLGAVVDELDRLKEGKDVHVRWRARYTLKVLDDLFHDPDSQPVLSINEGIDPVWRGCPVTIELLFDPIGHQRLPESDDEIIDRIVAAQPLAAREIGLITDDTGMATRARRQGLRVVKPPRDIGLEPQPQPKPKRRGQQGREQVGR